MTKTYDDYFYIDGRKDETADYNMFGVSEANRFKEPESVNMQAAESKINADNPSTGESGFGDILAKSGIGKFTGLGAKLGTVIGGPTGTLVGAGVGAAADLGMVIYNAIVSNREKAEAEEKAKAEQESSDERVAAQMEPYRDKKRNWQKTADYLGAL